jgi:hypothetical protein
VNFNSHSVERLGKTNFSMADNQNSAKVAITVAIIGLIGVVISNWDKIRPGPKRPLRPERPVPTQTSPTGRRMGPIEPGIRFEGFNLSPNALHAATAEECSEKCEQNESSVAMTFVRGVGDCWLKSSVPTSRSSAPNMASAIKRSR